MPVRSYKDTQNAHILCIILVTGIFSVIAIVDYCNGKGWNKTSTIVCSIFGGLTALWMIRYNIELERRGRTNKQLSKLNELI